MKPLYILVNMLICACLIFSCEKKDDDTGGPDPVKDVTVKAGYGELMFAWTNPEDSDLYYVDITYIDSNGKRRSDKVSSFVSADTIAGFADTNEYSFTLRTFDKNGNASEMVTVKASPLAPPYSLVLETVEMQPDFGGAKIFWKNETGALVTVQVSYKDNEGKKVISLFSTTESSGNGIISELGTQERAFSVSVTDASDIISEPKTFTFSPLAESKMDKSGWTIVDFSSEESAENPNGYAKNIFDNDVNSFWHTAWNGSQPGYPHWIIVDMHRPITISRFECFRRQGDDRGQTSHQFLTSLDGTTWEDQGTYDFDATSNNGQSYRISSNPSARYFKYVAVNGPNFYAFLGEITVYGAEN